MLSTSELSPVKEEDFDFLSGAGDCLSCFAWESRAFRASPLDG